MEPYEIDTPNGLRGLQIRADRAEVRAYFGEGWKSIRESSTGVPADNWQELGITALYTAGNEMFYLIFEHDNVELHGHRLNAMPFADACAAVEGLFPDASSNSDMTSSQAARVAVMCDQRSSFGTAMTSVFADDFVDLCALAGED